MKPRQWDDPNCHGVPNAVDPNDVTRVSKGFNRIPRTLRELLDISDRPKDPEPNWTQVWVCSQMPL